MCIIDAQDDKRRVEHGTYKKLLDPEGRRCCAYYLALPILWFTQYKDRHAYEFECLLETYD
jgi:hypothetical protein